MSKQQEPKKPKYQKSLRLNLSSKTRWERLLKEIKKEQVPIGVLRYITVNLVDGTCVNVDIEEMLAEGTDPELVEQLINTRLEQLDSIIKDVDFHISVDSVAKFVQPFTDNLLKDL